MKIEKEYRLNEAFLSYRRVAIHEPKPTDALKTPSAVFNIANELIGQEGREVFLVYFLDAANHIKAFTKAFTGTIDQAVIYPREVLRYCILADCSRIIVCHNHPSGVARPSEHDIAITKKLQEACGAVDIEMLDHIVIGDGQYYSFREHGLI